MAFLNSAKLTDSATLQGNELNLLSSLPLPLLPMPLPRPPPPLTVFSLTFLPIVHNLLKARNLGLTLAVTLENSAVVADIEGSIVECGTEGSAGVGTELTVGPTGVGIEGAIGGAETAAKRVGVVAVCGIGVCCDC